MNGDAAPQEIRDSTIPGRSLLRKRDVQQLEAVWAGAKGVLFQAKRLPNSCEAAVAIRSGALDRELLTLVIACVQSRTEDHAKRQRKSPRSRAILVELSLSSHKS